MMRRGFEFDASAFSIAQTRNRASPCLRCMSTLSLGRTARVGFSRQVGNGYAQVSNSARFCLIRTIKLRLKVEDSLFNTRGHRLRRTSEAGEVWVAIWITDREFEKWKIEVPSW